MMKAKQNYEGGDREGSIVSPLGWVFLLAHL